MEKKLLNISVPEAFEKLQDRIEVGQQLQKIGNSLLQRSDDEKRQRIFDNFNTQFTHWMDSTFKVLNEVFIEQDYGKGFLSADADHQNAEGKTGIENLIANQLTPRVNYLTDLVGQLSQFQEVNYRGLEEEEILEMLQVAYEKTQILDIVKSKDAVRSWAEEVAPLIKFNREFHDKFIIHKDAFNQIVNLPQLSVLFDEMKNQLKNAIDEMKLKVRIKQEREGL
ncbi:MAG: hypothetical protein Kow0098_15070 [Ignavibacteriaceae bacterium]